MPPKKGLTVKEYNTRLLQIFDELQREIEYPIGRTRYKKKIQTHSLEENVDYNKLHLLIENLEILPIISNKQVLEKVQQLLKKDMINGMVNSVVNGMKMDFEVLFGLIKVLYGDMKKENYNVSHFYRNIEKVLDTKYDNWQQLEEKEGRNVVFFFLQLLTLSVENLKIVLMPERQVFGKNVNVLYEREMDMTHSGIKNLWQQVNYQFTAVEKTGWFENNQMEYKMYVSVVLYNGKKKLDGQLEPEWVTLFHQPTIDWMNVRNHDVILNKTGCFLLTFGAFLQTKNAVDRLKYLCAGGLSKSVYNVRDTADVDFFVMDYGDNVEKYGSYKPNIGVGGIFDDFGKTYYSNEAYYFPMKPELYEKQQEYKRTIVKPSGPKNILDNYPVYSCSGLKAGRYVDIYGALCRKIGYRVNHLDDVVVNPEHRIYVFGCPVVQLKLELVRDMIKDIDLGRISKKQFHDLHYLYKNYEHLFEHNELQMLGMLNIENRTTNAPLLSLKTNIYHSNLEDAAFKPQIRRYPMYMEDIMKEWIKGGPLLVSSNNKIVEQDMMRTYQRPLLSSLPENQMYYYEISAGGELMIYVGEEASFYEDIVVSGNMRVEMGKDKKISLNVGCNKMKKIYQQLDTMDKKKEYRMLLVNMMKNLVQMHKIVDCHTRERVVVDLLK